MTNKDKDGFMRLLEVELEKLHGRNNPLWNYWIESHKNAVKKVSDRFSIFIKKYLPNSSEIRCLDLGCGTGAASIALALNKNKVVGLDYKIDGLGLKLAKKRGEEYCVDVSFIQGDGYTLPFKDNIFDFVYTAQVLEHAEHKDKFMKELYRVLGPDGIAFISAPNRLWYKEEHSGLILANLLPRDLCERYVKLRKRRYESDEWDVWLPTYWLLSHLFNNCGFEILADIIDYVAEYKHINIKIARFLSRIFPVKYFAPLLFIVQKC